MGKFERLHSHSGLERELDMEKRFVLVDEEFKNRFIKDNIEAVVYNNITYYKVPILSFVKNGGVFKNLNQ